MSENAIWLPPSQPTSEQCDENAVIEEREHDTTFATWHPQWGGYVGKCLVNVSANGCFEVKNWHDGEFPRDDYYDQKHYCDARQLLDFAILILERQARFRHHDDAPGELEESLAGYAARLVRLARAAAEGGEG